MILTINSILSFLCVFSPVFVYIALLSQPPGLRWGIAAATFVLLLIITTYAWARLNKRMMRILTERCDPDRLIRCCRGIVEHPLAPQYKQAVNSTRMLYAMGLVAAGRFKEAEGMADSATFSSNTLKGELSEIMRRLFKIDLYMHFKETEKAREEYEAIKLQANGFAERKPRWSDMLSNIINEYDLQFRIDEGSDEGAEEYYNSSFDKAKNTLSRVTAKYNLWLYYARRGEKEKAAQALKYAADNGNKLYIAKEARRILRELSQNNADIA